MKKTVIILLLIILFAAGIFWNYKRVANNRVEVVDDVVTFETKEMTAEEKIENDKFKQAEQDWNNAVKATAAIDKDFDGLKDVDETKYGTDLNNMDTDADGLLDGAEVNIFKTNPVKADTDGDGIKDGEEARRGEYNKMLNNKIKK